MERIICRWACGKYIGWSFSRCLRIQSTTGCDRSNEPPFLVDKSRNSVDKFGPEPNRKTVCICQETNCESVLADGITDSKSKSNPTGLPASVDSTHRNVIQFSNQDSRLAWWQRTVHHFGRCFSSSGSKSKIPFLSMLSRNIAASIQKMPRCYSNWWQGPGYHECTSSCNGI